MFAAAGEVLKSKEKLCHLLPPSVLSLLIWTAPCSIPRARSPPHPAGHCRCRRARGHRAALHRAAPASLPPLVAQLPGIRYAITANGAAVWDMGTDPLGAVYSRYSDAARRQTHQPVRLLHRPMPPETAREAFCALSGVPRPAEHLFRTGAPIWTRRVWSCFKPGKTGTFPPRPASRTMAAITLCVTSPSG